MRESNSEQCEQNDPADPRDRHEGREETTWRILMAPAQVTPKSLRAFIVYVSIRLPGKFERLLTVAIEVPINHIIQNMESAIHSTPNVWMTRRSLRM